MTLSIRALKESYHAAKFGGHWHCGSGDIIVLDCHMISQNHVTKRLGNFMGRNH